MNSSEVDWVAQNRAYNLLCARRHISYARTTRHHGVCSAVVAFHLGVAAACRRAATHTHLEPR